MQFETKPPLTSLSSAPFLDCFSPRFVLLMFARVLNPTISSQVRGPGDPHDENLTFQISRLRPSVCNVDHLFEGRNIIYRRPRIDFRVLFSLRTPANNERVCGRHYMNECTDGLAFSAVLY